LSAADSSGCGNHGRLTGPAQWTDGKFGKAIHFSSGASVNVASSSSLSAEKEVTIAAWMKILTRPGEFSWQCVFGQAQDYRNYNFYVKNGDSPAGPPLPELWQLGIYQQPGNRFSKTAPALEGGAWHHVAGAITAADGGSHRFYLDGRLVHEARNVGFERLVPNKAAFGIGWCSGSFIGCLDEVRVYRRELSAEEVARLARRGEGTPTP